MIIEAGYDVTQLLAPKMFGRKAKTALWVVAFDIDLRFVRLKKAGDGNAATVESSVTKIVKALRADPSPVAYYAFARVDTEHLDCHGEELREQDRYLREHPQLSGFELIGSYISNGRNTCSSVPRFRFRDYIGLEHYPRAAVWYGPHEFITCPCAACVQFEERLSANRARHENSTTEQ